MEKLPDPRYTDADYARGEALGLLPKASAERLRWLMFKPGALTADEAREFDTLCRGQR